MAKEYPYLCLHQQSINSDIILLHFIPDTDIKMAYRAGQYVEALFADNLVLPLSIANAPSADGALEFHLRHNAQHPMANAFLNALLNNKKVMLRGPFGEATLARQDEAKEIVMLAGGTGFTPFKALLEEALLQQKCKKQITLFWGVRHPDDAYKLKLLHAWQQRYSQFDFHIVLSEPHRFPAWQGPRGLVHEYLAKNWTNFEETIVFASGPFAMVKAAFSLFTKHGLKPRQFISDMLMPSTISCA